MDGLLLKDGTFIRRTTLHHIDMVHQFYPTCKSEKEAVEKHNCIFICEYRDFHSGVHDAANDYLLFKNGFITKEQLDFFKEHIDELTMSQIIQIEELAKMKNVNIYDFCYECFDYEDRYDFIHGKKEKNFNNYEEQYLYHMCKYSPNDYCEKCKNCEKLMKTSQ